MSKPYTHEDIVLMSTERYLELVEMKSRFLHPYCLIGLPLSEARKKMADWVEHYGYSRDSVKILVAGKDEYFGDTHIDYWYCTVDENNIMTDVWPVS